MQIKEMARPPLPIDVVAPRGRGARCALFPERVPFERGF